MNNNNYYYYNNYNNYNLHMRTDCGHFATMGSKTGENRAGFAWHGVANTDHGAS